MNEIGITQKALHCAIEGTKFKGFRAHPKAQSYNYISGTFKNGEVERFDFLDDRGRLVKKVTRFVDKENNEKLSLKYYERNVNEDLFVSQKKMSQTAEIIAVNGKVVEYIKKSLYSFSAFRTKKSIFKTVALKKVNGGIKETHSYQQCKPKSPAKKLEFEVKYDGTPIEVKTKNLTVDLSEAEKEYLPMVASKSTKRFEYLQNLFLKKNNIDGTLTNLPTREGVLGEDAAAEYWAMDAQIHIEPLEMFESNVINALTGAVENLSRQEKEIAAIGHEATHVAQWGRIARLPEINTKYKAIDLRTSPEYKSFAQKNIEKHGHIKVGSEAYHKAHRHLKEFSYYESLTQRGCYDRITSEQEALNAGIQARETYKGLAHKLQNIFVIN